MLLSTIAMRQSVFLVALALAALPAQADILYCNATITESSGNVQPWPCLNGLWSHVGSSITARGDTLYAFLDNSIVAGYGPPPGWSEQFQGEAETSVSGELVVLGGSGTGLFMDSRAPTSRIARILYNRSPVTPDIPSRWPFPLRLAYRSL
jgi:hypothetical protein